MIGRRPLLLMAALLCGAFAAGCGSSSSTTSSSATASTPAASTTPATSTTAAAKPTPTSPATAPTAAASAAAVAQYVAICKSIIARVPTLSASEKAKVEGICNKAASGDLAGAREAAKEVCIEVIDASPISGADKAKDLVECKGA